MASVLMVNLSPEKASFLQVMSVRLNFRCRNVLPQEQSCRISDLLSGSVSGNAFTKPFRDEMLIMDGISHPDLNFLLNEMRRCSQTIALKAVTTPTNVQWTVAALHMQLVAENREMHSGRPGAEL